MVNLKKLTGGQSSERRNRAKPLQPETRLSRVVGEAGYFHGDYVVCCMNNRRTEIYRQGYSAGWQAARNGKDSNPFIDETKEVATLLMHQIKEKDAVIRALTLRLARGQQQEGTYNEQS